MSTYLEEKVTHGDSTVAIRIEIDEEQKEQTPWRPYSYGPMRGGGDKSLPKRAFEEGMTLIRACAEQVTDTMRKVEKAVRPDEVEVTFGVKLTGELGAWIAKQSSEAHMEVTLKWNKEKKSAN